MQSKLFIASDHAGYALKEALVPFLRSLEGYQVEDLGPHSFDPADDYPEYAYACARAVAAHDPDAPSAKRFGIVIGASGQGEAMAANRVEGVRAAVYYGAPAKGVQTDAAGTVLGMIESVRAHNDANVLSLGARFLSEGEAKEAVRRFLATPFSGESRHKRRIAQL